MDASGRIRDTVSRHLPLPVFVALVCLISIVWLLLFLLLLPVAWPLAYAYRLALSAFAKSKLRKSGKDIVVITNGELEESHLIAEIWPLIKSRAIVLNYEERRSWSRWSLPTLLFNAFGPTIKPGHLLPKCLPAIILMKKSHFPVQFSFGPLIMDRETQVRQLRDALAVN